MPPASVFVVIFGALLVPNLAELASPPVLFAEYPVVTTCGGTLTVNYSAIAYKTSTNVGFNERCEWTIRTPNASGYTLEVLYLGFSLELGRIVFTSTCEDSTGTITINISGTGVVQLPSACQSLIISFFSGESVSYRGFILWYKASNLSSSDSEGSARPILLHPQYPVVSTCGGILTSNNSAIDYKTEVNVHKHERCVWTISSPNAASYSLNVVSLGLEIEISYTGITATCINRDWTNKISYTSLRTSGEVRLPFTCHKLLITFFSGQYVESRGFILWYKAIPGPNYISSSSQDYIVSDPKQHLRYPTDTDANYNNNEVSTFVFGMPNNLFNYSRQTLLIYVRGRLEGSGCSDLIQHYKFIRGWWTFSSQVCGGTEMAQWYHDDLMLVTFKTDASVVNRGFQISSTSVFNTYNPYDLQYHLF